MISIMRRDGDDAGYLKMVASIVTALTESGNSQEFYVVRVDNWFGSKWLTFSGKMLGLVGVWKSQITLPPFVPNRIVEEKRAKRLKGGAGFAEDVVSQHVHRTVPSSEATKRRIAVEFPDTTFVWFSGNTEVNGKGCVMAYIPNQEQYWCWYAELSSRNNWEPSLLKGISRSEFHQLLGLELSNT